MQTTEENPLPCPFCGKAAVMMECRDVTDGFAHGYTIWCGDCGIEMSDEYRSEVVTNWNRRAPLSIREEAEAAE